MGNRVAEADNRGPSSGASYDGQQGVCAPPPPAPSPDSSPPHVVPPCFCAAPAAADSLERAPVSRSPVTNADPFRSVPPAPRAQAGVTGTGGGARGGAAVVKAPDQRSGFNGSAAAGRLDGRPPVARSTATNTDRTRNAPPAPYARAGVTSTGDAVYAGAAAVKGRDPRTGIEVETFTVSAQVGAQNEAQAGVARVGVSSSDGADSAAVELLTARAWAGVHNADGSTGVNGGAMAMFVGLEGTLGFHGNSVTAGISLGVGAEASIGIRDADGDGRPELCRRVSVLFFTLGSCTEALF